MDLKEQLKSLSVQDRKELLKQLQQEEKENKRNRRDAYEGLRAQFILEVKIRLFPVVDDVKAFRDWVEKEAASFRDLMRDYGQLDKDVIVLGVSNRVEIWSKATWDEYSEQISPTVASIAESLVDLGI